MILKSLQCLQLRQRREMHLPLLQLVGTLQLALSFPFRGASQSVWVTITMKVRRDLTESSGLPLRKGALALLQLAAQLPSPEAS